jgi:DNA mismatch repair protein MSH3
MLNEIIHALPKLREPVRKLVRIVDLGKAAEGRKDEMWADEQRAPRIGEMNAVS